MTLMSRSFFAVIPAAGTGSRLGAGMAKQYLLLNGKPLIQHTLSALLSEPGIDLIVVVLAPDDAVWNDACLPDGASQRVRVVREGGVTRSATVLSGINWLAANAKVDCEDWILVHDAARPCIHPVQITAFIDTLRDDPVGGLLAIPVADTLKRADADNRVEATVDRQQLWQAQTPQMFRMGTLHSALSVGNLSQVTDEASAIEALGLQPKLVPGSLTNLKVTYSEDLSLAAMILAATKNRSVS